VSGPRGPLPTRVQDLEPLPPEYAATLDAGLSALGLDLDPGDRRAIDAHARFLLAWTPAINLTSIRDPAAVARLHVLDSLAAVPHLRRLGVTGLLDLGSGGGFPGLPVAVGLGSQRALLVDSVGKKARFLTTVVEATGLGRKVAAEAARAEELVELALPLLAPGGVLVAWKREPIGDELDAAGPALRALRAGAVDVVPAGVPGLESHRLVIVHRGAAADARFPRDPAERRRRPL
jgi:16S rRNA (guanine527-N7)-methyltransferase